MRAELSLQQEELAESGQALPDGASPAFAVRECANTIITPETPTFVLRPDFANIHAFHAIGEVVVLDVLLPPYDEEHGRDCHYLAPAPASGGSGAPDDSVRHLCVVAAPPELVIRAGEYRGPPVSLHPARST